MNTTIRIFGYEPAVLLQAVNACVALLVAFGLGLSEPQVSAITVLATAAVSIATAVMTRPVVVSAVTGGIGTALSAVAAFGLELDAQQIGAVVTASSIVLALLLRQAVSPSPALVAKR
ncbi:MAG: hypothetical protein ACRDOO_19130 [Actinomadura sp.]